VTTPTYQPLSREQIAVLLAPGNADLERAWDALSGALHGLIAVYSDTHPRPLYFNEEKDRRDLTEQPLYLRGTPFHEIAMHNVRAAEAIERMARERGSSPEVQGVVDRYVDQLLDESDAIRAYPGLPPYPRLAQSDGALEYRAVVSR
jgi:hypothetical protein